MVKVTRSTIFRSPESVCLQKLTYRIWKNLPNAGIASSDCKDYSWKQQGGPTNRQNAKCPVRSARSNKNQNHWLKWNRVISRACACVSLSALHLSYYAILLHCEISVKLPPPPRRNVQNNIFIREIHLSFFYNICSYFFAKKRNMFYALKHRRRFTINVFCFNPFTEIFRMS